jgi:hypothetical protein
MRYLSSILLALVGLMALACTATPATPAPTPLPTPDVPLLDEETVKNLTTGFLYGNIDVEWRYKECSMTSDTTTNINAQYVGKDIWVVVIEPLPTTCTFTVHDKEAHVILSREAMTTD